LDPSSADASIQLARLLAGLGKPTEARKVLEDAMARNHWSAALRFELAGVLEREGRLLDAQKRYEDAIGLDAASHLASARIASLIARQNGNLDVALRYASSAKQGLPSNPEVDDTLGWIMVLKRRAAVALPHLEAAVKAQPNQPTYRYHLGAAYDQLGRFPDARRELVKALEIDSAFPGAADAKKLLAAIGG
jgi:Flp pilus assembly protein TadD